MQQIKLSIIIPAYNVEKYIQKCLESCLNQNIDFNEYEIIIINDGSKDDTLEIVKEFISQNQTCNISIINKKNGGLSSARNEGLKYARGEYVWFVDSDDTIVNNILKTILDEVESEGLDMLWFDHILVNEENLLLSKPVIDIKDSVSEAVFSGRDFLSKCFRQSCMVCMFIFRRSFLLTNSLCFYEGIYFEDMLFIPKAIFYSNKIKYKHIVGYKYLIRSNSIMRDPSKIEKRIFDSLFVCSELKKFKINNKLEKQVDFYFDNLITMIALYNLRRSIKDCDLVFAMKTFKRGKELSVVPLDYAGPIKRKSLIFFLNNFYYIFVLICKILP